MSLAWLHARYLDDEPPTAAGRELWGFPKRHANPSLVVEKDTLVGTLHHAGLCV